MRTILALIAGLFLCASAGAAEFPSDTSAAYTGEDRSCTIVLSNAGTVKRGELRCLVWATGDQIEATSQVHANGVCPTDFYFPMRSSLVPVILPDTPELRLVAVDAQSSTVRVGLRSEIAMDGGDLQVWSREASLPSPAPYTCAPLQPRPPVRPTLCGEFGWFCG